MNKVYVVTKVSDGYFRILNIFSDRIDALEFIRDEEDKYPDFLYLCTEYNVVMNLGDLTKNLGRGIK
jgi:hypothetical protein